MLRACGLGPGHAEHGPGLATPRLYEPNTSRSSVSPPFKNELSQNDPHGLALGFHESEEGRELGSFLTPRETGVAGVARVGESRPGRCRMDLMVSGA